MKFLQSLVLALLPAVKLANAATNFAGTNLYYAAGLTDSQRAKYLEYVGIWIRPMVVKLTFSHSALKDAGMKVIRVWLDGQSGTPKVNYTPITSAK